ncbi:16S rRNA (cytosine(1402)-N(4))-methyltransferase RsmH [Patulibacter brassicae]|uniref:Ribosomal RNA small subunit methyltransferase H n=1 Tax=Patulibacter brassicae TaxID=1705717 RepID=A0ABU4VLM3_9ACTN|nr:16S rRNA (cytosine(1402)-N(4))-methyltransferase RsmH [Patulibacter brassicae]MDX8152728.1 16S rRNA (cytosine(1402)-N(4))-methyltransferase RsmH [Patulibacter brassicae]
MARRRPTAPPEPATAPSADARDAATDAPHLPVLAEETLELLDARPGETIVDATFGAGGHARLVAERLGPTGTLVVIDRDPVALALAERFAAEAPCAVRIVGAPFADALEGLAEEGFRADGAYFDLGMSSMQIDEPERGFSYVRDAPLDMRMGEGSAQSAAEVVATWGERELAAALRELGEERHASRIARAIVREREKAPIETTGRLVDVVTDAIPTPARFAGGHPAKRTFQALRIVVNDELGQIDRALPAAWRLLRRGGRLVAISFHSLEDRRVKRFLADRAQGCICPPDLPVCGCGKVAEAELLTRGIAPTAAEQERNPRSRSARVRAARRIEVPA